jgi:hypothetical protein
MSAYLLPLFAISNDDTCVISNGFHPGMAMATRIVVAVEDPARKGIHNGRAAGIHLK